MAEQVKTEVVFFDKDGTLLDFDAFWVTVSEYAVKEILNNIGMHDVDVNEVLTALGVIDGVTDINGVLCYGTYGMISEKIHEFLRTKGCNTDPAVLNEITGAAYCNAADKGRILPTSADLSDTLQKIKNMGTKVVLVTADGPLLTDKCIDGLKIRHYFDEIYTDNGIYPPKPDPYCINEFCEKFNIDKNNAVMVGDTVTDVQLAKNAEIRMIGVAKGYRNKQVLQKATDIVVDDISCIVDML